jgi:EAL domain-containing protein (putative c-di-GMP-specific phosphodiesterase class I)
VSIGIVSSGPDDDPDALLRHADVAMYTAKEHRLGHARFDKNQEHATISRLTLLGDLRRALDANDEIELHYQPKMSVGTGELIGAEALARWQHPARGLIGPDEFIPILEGTSLIHRFTMRVLDLALVQVRRWLDDGHRVPVAVNVSTRSLLDTTFPDAVADALRRAGVPGDLLAIEITENTVMADPTRAIDVLRRIRDLGISTAIDDFGTGYSSMAYLKILPVDEIKVDRSFVREMATDHSNYTLVGSTVDLGHNLGLVVVAEGVEDADTAAALDRLGCDIAQGYHFARPLPPRTSPASSPSGTRAAEPAAKPHRARLTPSDAMPSFLGMDLRGHLDLLLLATLRHTGPVHGYALITALRNRSDGAFDLPEGTVYPALHRLERDGSVASTWDTGRAAQAPDLHAHPGRRGGVRGQADHFDAFVAGVRAVLQHRVVLP